MPSRLPSKRFVVVGALTLVAVGMVLMSACSSSTRSSTTSSTAVVTTVATPTTEQSDRTPSSVGTPSTGGEHQSSDGSQAGPVSSVEAGQIAVAQFGGTVKSIESDHSHGKPTWEVELRDSSQGRIEVDIEKATGKILEVEHD